MTTFYDRPIPYQMYNMERHVKYTGFSSFLRWMGNESPAENPTIGHYETPWREDLVPVGSIVTASGGAGNTMVIALAASAMFAGSATVSGSATLTSYPLVGDIIEFEDNVQAQVTAKNVSTNPHRITVKPLVSTDDLDAVVTVGEEYAIFTNLFAEGSGLPQQRLQRYFKYNNTFGICKTAVYFTGSEITNMIYPETTDGDKGSVYVHVKPQMMADHERARDGMLLFGRQANNLTALSSNLGIDVSITGTEGALTFAKTGNTDTYTAGSYGLADLEQVGAILEDQRASNDENIMVWQGPEAQREINTAMLDILSNDLCSFVMKQAIPGYDGFDFNAYGDTNERYDQQFTFGIYAVRWGGFNFAFKKLPVFADIRNAGADIYDYRATNVFCPTEKQPIRKKSMGVMNYEYKAMDGYNRNLQASISAGHGAAGKYGQMFASHDEDTAKESLVSEIAMHCCCNNKLVVQTPA